MAPENYQYPPKSKVFTTHSLTLRSEGLEPGSKMPLGRWWMRPIRWAMRTCSSSLSWLAKRRSPGVGWYTGTGCGRSWKKKITSPYCACFVQGGPSYTQQPPVVNKLTFIKTLKERVTEKGLPRPLWLRKCRNPMCFNHLHLDNLLRSNSKI